MDYIKVTVETTGAAAEELADLLAGITGGCEVDDPETAVRWAADAASRWDYIEASLLEDTGRPVTVNFYLADDPAGHEIMRQACQAVAGLREAEDNGRWGTLAIRVAPMENQDWATSWRQYFKPFTVGDRLRVKPSWVEEESDPALAVITIDPSSSFGTGTHATTQMCLGAIAGLSMAGGRVLDIGCGSGILACGALALGAGHAVCCDIEQDAMAATAENMARNGFGSGRYTLLKGDILADAAFGIVLAEQGPFDVILANIVADVLIAMADKLARLLAEDGVLVMSGIIDRRADEVEAAALQAGFTVAARRQDDGWTALTLRPVG